MSGKEKVHKCDTCGKMLAERGHLTAHIRTVHDKVARLSCPYCKYRTDHQRDLTRHMLTHTGDKQYKCTHCDYTAIMKQSLTAHIYNNHTNKTYRCRYKQCGVKKPSEQELYDHISTEHPLQQYRCQCEENVLVRNIPGKVALVYLFASFFHSYVSIYMSCKCILIKIL